MRRLVKLGFSPSWVLFLDKTRIQMALPAIGMNISLSGKWTKLFTVFALLNYHK